VRLAAFALVVLTACAPPSNDVPDDPFLRSLASAAEAELDAPLPPLPSLSANRTALTPDEARALVRNLVPRVPDSATDEWTGFADAALEDALTAVCGETIPLDRFGYYEEHVADYFSRALTGGQGSATVTAIAFDGTPAADEAMDRVSEALLETACPDERIQRRPELEGDAAYAFTIEPRDDRYTQCVLVVRAGPVVVLATGASGRLPAAPANALGMLDHATTQLRASGLMPR